MEYQIQSQYIKDKIQGATYSDVELVKTIKELCELESYILNFPTTHSRRMRFLNLQSIHSHDYMYILQELHPQAYEEEINEQKEEEKSTSVSDTIDEMNWWKSYKGVGVDELIEMKLKILHATSQDDLIKLEQELIKMRGE